jgi:S1-C subfamily serine protease
MHRSIIPGALTLILLAGPSFAAPTAGKAEEPLWSEGASKAALPKNAPINMQAFVKLAGTLGPAVVNVVAIQTADGPDDRPGGNGGGGGDKPRGHGRGQGTGFVIHKSGFILTNSHVIEGADDIRVRLSDERELSARLVGRDDRTDIALLKIEAGADLAVAPLGNSDEVQIGEWVMAIGNPFGLDHTVTAGIISAKGRRDVRPGGSQTGYYDFIQTDASINPGNSGGPLLDATGRVVGINSQIETGGSGSDGNVGIGFAIPIDTIKHEINTLKAKGTVQYAYLGVSSQTIDSSFAGLLPAKTGALVQTVTSGSPAAKAGLRGGDITAQVGGTPVTLGGDIITKVDGQSVKTADDLTAIVGRHKAGDKVKIQFLRHGKSKTAEVSLGRRPASLPSDQLPSQAP